MSQTHHCCQGSGCGTNRPTPTLLLGAVLLMFAAACYFFVLEPPWLFAALATSATVTAGAPVAATGFRAARRGRFDMNLLIVIAATGAIAIGDYFEAATAMCLFALSLWLEQLSVARANRAVRSLVELAPRVAHRLSASKVTGSLLNGITDIDPNLLERGDAVLVRPGERLPADGEVLEGTSNVNQAPITGESVPVEKQPGAAVFAGTLNGEGALVVRVTRAAHESTLAHIARLIESARSSRGPTQRFIDEFARRYTPAVILLSIALMTLPPLLTHFGMLPGSEATTVDWIHRGLVLLVIACPCALVISTPVTIVSALHAAARGGILVKGGEFLERAGGLRRIAIDKTGTLTTGHMQLTALEAFHGTVPEAVLSLAAGLEQQSEHPLAAAILAAAQQRGVLPAAADDTTALRGFGVRGEIAGQRYFLGNARLFDSPEVALSAQDRDRLKYGESGGTTAFLGTSNLLLGQLQLADTPRPSTREAVSELRALGVLQIVMLTGDNAAAARQIAEQVGIDDIRTDLLPQDKIALVQSLRSGGPVAMIGDGVNDAPALAAADVGIVLGGSASDTALETADVVVMAPELGKVAALMRISRRARTLLKQNIAFALGTKLVVIALAALGLATMWMAVAADVGASLLVIANGMRALSKE